MKQIRKRITYANVMSSIAVFLVLGGASAYAAKKIGSNEIKGNSITTGKIKKNAITASKIKKNSITTAKIKNGAVTGAKVNVGTLGTVPNATHATTADTATNFSRYFNLGMKKASVGQTEVALGSVGPFSFVGDCEGTGAEPEANIYLKTSVNGSEMESYGDQYDWEMTTADRAEIGYSSTQSTSPYGNFYSYYDGWVAATPTGTFLSGEAHPMVKVFGADCAFLVYGFNETP
ncbi:MAG TPA: hypothetical protein VG816_00060 [Solirubrobacterales bacterium]|nr:hypothetical protein [Solirubrobacterales bacterium]